MAAETTPPASGWTWLDNRAIDMSPFIGSRDWILYTMLARLSGGGRSCRVSVSAIEKVLSVSRSTVQRGLIRLENLGLIQSTAGHSQRGQQAENHYQLLTPTPTTPQCLPSYPSCLEGVSTDTPGGVSPDTPPRSPQLPLDNFDSSLSKEKKEDKNVDDDDEERNLWKEERELANTLRSEGLAIEEGERFSDDDAPRFRALTPTDRIAILRICRLAVDGKIPLDILTEQAAVVRLTAPKKVGPYFRACVIKAVGARLDRNIVPLLDAIQVPKELTER